MGFVVAATRGLTWVCQPGSEAALAIYDRALIAHRVKMLLHHAVGRASIAFRRVCIAITLTLRPQDAHA